MGDQMDIDVQTAGGNITRRVRWTITDFIAGHFSDGQSIAAEQMTILAGDEYRTPLVSLALRCFPKWDTGIIKVQYRLTRLDREVCDIAKGDISVYVIDKDGHKWDDPDGYNDDYDDDDDDDEKEEDTTVICKGGVFINRSKLEDEKERLLPDNALILCFEVTLAYWPTVVTRIAKPATITFAPAE